MKEDKLKRFYFTEYKNDDDFVGELGLYIENLLSTQKKELLEKIEKLISEKGQSWDSANGLGPDVILVDDLEDIKKHLTLKEKYEVKK